MEAAEWQRGRWWRVIAPDGSLWAETSSEKEARMLMRPGDRLFKEYVRTEQQWREVDVQ